MPCVYLPGPAPAVTVANRNFICVRKPHGHILSLSAVFGNFTSRKPLTYGLSLLVVFRNLNYTRKL